MTDEDRARIKAEARATLARLADLPSTKAHDVLAYELEDPVRRWAREADEQEARFAEQRRRAKDQERRAREQSAVADMQAELADVLMGIATALGVLDERLKKIEERRRTNKTARKRPIALPSFLGPTHAAHDPSVRYTQPRVQ
jgi:hypothetical protein